MIALDHMPAVEGKTVVGWNYETYFMANTTIERIKSHGVPPAFMRVHYRKTDEEDQKWMTPENRFVDVSPAQEFLMSDGSIKPAAILEEDDELQHSCGNGHSAKIEKVEWVRENLREFVDFEGSPQPWIVVRGGIILREGEKKHVRSK